jgi:hypothetical protein
MMQAEERSGDHGLGGSWWLSTTFCKSCRHYGSAFDPLVFGGWRGLSQHSGCCVGDGFILGVEDADYLDWEGFGRRLQCTFCC